MAPIKTTFCQAARWSWITRYIADHYETRAWCPGEKDYFTRRFVILDEANRVGKMVLDLGSSVLSMAHFLCTNLSHHNIGRTVVAFDIGFPGALRESATNDPKLFQVKGDAHQIMEVLGREEIAKALNTRAPKFNTILVSDLLNYVDYRHILTVLVEHLLADDGLLIIRNLAGVLTEPGLSHPDGVKKNSELTQFIVGMARSLALEEGSVVELGFEQTTDQYDVRRQIFILRKRPALDLPHQP